MVIANCIIDQRRVEFVLLCDDPDQATSVMLENPPADYTEMFAMNGDQFYSKPCFRLFMRILPFKKFIFYAKTVDIVFSALTRFLGIRKSIRHVNLSLGCLFGMRCK